jgi:rare lipoprotein A
VEVTNVATGRVITLRVEDKAAMPGAIVRLPASAAAALGADPKSALLVRVRYVAPLLAYEGRAPLRYALRAPSSPPGATPIRTAVATAPAAAAPHHALLASASPTKAKPAPDLANAMRGARPAPALAGAVDGGFRVQAGAFASRANAERAADRLEVAGATSIETMRQGSLTLYRVVVGAPKTAGEAERLRARVAEVGFPDAWILRPL